MYEGPTTVPEQSLSDERARLYWRAFPRYFRSVAGEASVRSRFVHGFFWSTFGSFLGQAFKLATAVLCGRLLGQIGFGEFGMATSTLMILGILAGSGLGMVATSQVADLKTRDFRRAGGFVGTLTKAGFLAGIAIAAVIIVLAQPICSLLLNAPHLSNVLRIGAFLPLLTVLNGIQLGALNGLEAFRSAAWLAFAEGILGLVFTGFGGWTLGLNGAVGGTLCASSVVLLLGHWLLRAECRKHGIVILYQKLTSESKLLWNQGLPAVFVLAGSQPFFWWARAILAHQPDGYAEIGLLNAAMAWAAVLVFFPRQVSRPTLPILADLHGKGNSGEFSRMLVLSLVISLISALAVGLPLLVLAGTVMRSYGDSFAAGTPVLMVLTLAHILGAGTMCFRDAIAASGRMWVQFWHSLIWGLVLILAAALLTSRGAMGVAIGFLIAYAVLFMIQSAFLVKRRLFVTG